MRQLGLAIVALAASAQAQACPAASVHAETSRLVQMGAGGQPGAKAYDAKISAPALKCETRAGSMKIILTFKVDAALAPNVEAKPVRTPYFVVVLYGDIIIAKEVFTVALPFEAAAQTISLTETVDKISLPVRRNAEPGYEILVGFQLTPEQLRAAQN